MKRFLLHLVATLSLAACDSTPQGGDGTPAAAPTSPASYAANVDLATIQVPEGAVVAVQRRGLAPVSGLAMGKPGVGPAMGASPEIHTLSLPTRAPLDQPRMPEWRSPEPPACSVVRDGSSRCPVGYEHPLSCTSTDRLPSKCQVQSTTPDGRIAVCCAS